jgi:hypothetical protein
MTGKSDGFGLVLLPGILRDWRLPGTQVARTTVKIVGRLRFTDEDGLQYSLPVGKPEQTFWLEALPETDNWPTLGKRPERPKLVGSQWKAVEEKWKRATETYTKDLHADPTYKAAASEFMAKQQQEPKLLYFVGSLTFWAFREKVLSLGSSDPEIFFQKEKDRLQVTENAILLIKHHVLRRERHFEKIKREVEALENMEKLTGLPRQPIHDSVRLFVWQRNSGQCVKCGSRERLEFDHIIPAAAGGSSTERNIQLLCETCNRSKGSMV